MSRHQITQTDFDWGESLLLRGMEDRLLTHFSFMTGDPYEWSRLLRKVYRPYRQLGPGFWCEERIIREPERVALRLVAMGCWMEEIWRGEDEESKDMRHLGFARDYYRRALGTEPLNRVTSYLAYNNLGRCLQQTDKYADSETFCRAAAALAPHLSEAHWYLAIALWDQCRYYEAAESFISAANGHPGCIGAIGSLENLLIAHPELRGELGERLDEFRAKFQHFYPIEVPRFREFEIRDRLPKWLRRLMGRTHETPGSRSIRLES